MNKRILMIVITLIVLFPFMSGQWGCKGKDTATEEDVSSLQQPMAPDETPTEPSDETPLPSSETPGEGQTPSTQPSGVQAQKAPESIATLGDKSTVPEIPKKFVETKEGEALKDVDEELTAKRKAGEAIKEYLSKLRLGEEYEVFTDIFNGFKVKCNEDDVMVGVNFRAGHIVDKIVEIKCKPLLKLNDASVAPTKKAVNIGGSGGSLGEVNATLGCALSGFSMKKIHYVGDNNPLTEIGELRMIEVKVDSQNGVIENEAGSIGPKFGVGDADYPWINAVCPADHVITGVVAGSSTQFLNYMGIYCRRVYAAGKTAPVIPKGQLALGTGLEYLPFHASKGSKYFSKQCPENKVMVGWDARAGDIVDQLTSIRCLDINDVVNQKTESYEEVTVGGGGSGGSGPYPVPAPLGYAQQGWYIMNGYWDGFDCANCEVVGGLNAYFVPVETNGHVMYTDQVTVHNFGTGVASTWSDVFRCPYTHVLTGVNGISGEYLNALGGFCRDVIIGQ